MLKARNFITTFVITYVVIMIISIFVETAIMRDTADELNMTVKMASKMALIQSQSIDDAWSKNIGSLMVEEGSTAESAGSQRIGLNIKWAGKDDSHFSTTNLMSYLYNVRGVSNTEKAEIIYKKLYSTPDFMEWVQKVGSIPTQTYKVVNGDAEFIRIPKVLQMGTELFKTTDSTGWYNTSMRNVMYSMYLRSRKLVDGTSGDLVEKPISGGINFLTTNSTFFDDYGMNSILRSSSPFADSIIYEGKEIENVYTVTPLNLGLTYINTELASALFYNNINLIMRSNFDGKLEEYTGIPISPFLQDGTGNRATQNTVYSIYTENHFYKVNNGRFAVDIGNSKYAGTNGIRVFDNSITKRNMKNDSKKRASNVSVKYKTIDMYDSKYDAILINIFGQKAAQLKEKDTAVDMVHYYQTGEYKKPEHKYIVVAECTFEVRVIVPYMTPVMREWAMNYNDVKALYNYADLKENNRDDIIYSYTTMFAVA